MFINSLDDFYIHTKNHINNVVSLADELMNMVEKSEMLKKYYNIPEDVDFNEIKKIVHNGVILHDQAKINLSNEFLEKYGLDEPFYKKLYSRYGKGRNPDEWKITKPIIDKLNSIDELIIEEYCSNYPEWIQKLIKGIESTADKVERGCNPITPEEMGQPPLKASKFLEGQINEYEMAMVKVLEERYHEFCEFNINKRVISKNKYYEFIESNNLEPFIEEDGLSFKIKDELQIYKTEELISNDHTYNKVSFEIIKNNLEEHIRAWLGTKKFLFIIEKEESYENYQLTIKNLNTNNYFKNEHLTSYKNKQINKIFQNQHPYLSFIYEKDSPIFDQNRLNKLINSKAIQELKLKIDNLYNTDFFVELNEFIEHDN